MKSICIFFTWFDKTDQAKGYLKFINSSYHVLRAVDVEFRSSTSNLIAMITPESTQKNVFGKPLKPCCLQTATGFFRDGFCHTVEQDIGMHTVCALMTADYLEFSLSKGNDLTTPKPKWISPS